MITQVAGQCGVGYMLLSSLVGGWLGSLGFITNMVIVSGVVYLYKQHKSKADNPTVVKVVKDMLNRK